MKRGIQTDTAPEWIEPAAVLAQQQGAPPEPLPPAQRGGLSLVLSNAGANIARQVSALLVVLVLPPLLVRSLDRPTYAVWLLILQIASYITLIDNGIQTVIARYVALERATTGAAGVSRVLTNATVLLGIVAGIMTLLFAVGSPALSWFIPSESSSLLHPAERALAITAVTAALALPFSSLAGMFAGDQRSEINAIAATIGKVAGAAGVAWVAMRHRGLVAMALAMAAGTVLQSLLYVTAARIRPTAELFVWRLIRRSYLGEVFMFSLGMMVSQLAGLLISGMDLPLVSAFDFPQTAYYGLALTASNLLLVPFASITGPLMPLVTSVHAKGDARRLGEVVIEITRWGNILLGLLVLFLGMSLPALLHWWVRQEYATRTLPLAEILIAAQAVRQSCALYAMTGFSAGKQTQMLISPIGEGIVNLMCSFIGAKWLGAPGVALGSVVGAFAGVLLQLFVNLKRTQDVIEMRAGLFLVQGILKPLLSITPVVPIFFIGRLWVTTAVQLLALAMVCSLMSIPLALFLGMTSEDRLRLNRYLSRWIARFA
ncbi:lipopolysaccharide biosynthesis protein [Silvibacterium sp.]|uniref:lipopolysaccharide biosynthesis protein n=1 Tax=Silvibacterium sp. TaxID=1964179 RepID=UPI0039E50E97